MWLHSGRIDAPLVFSPNDPMRQCSNVFPFQNVRLVWIRKGNRRIHVGRAIAYSTCSRCVWDKTPPFELVSKCIHVQWIQLIMLTRLSTTKTSSHQRFALEIRREIRRKITRVEEYIIKAMLNPSNNAGRSLDCILLNDWVVYWWSSKCSSICEFESLFVTKTNIQCYAPFSTHHLASRASWPYNFHHRQHLSVPQFQTSI